MYEEISHTGVESLILMDPVRNPYAPGAGQRPPELAGRDLERARFGVLLDRLEAGRVERGMILTGLRGSAKPFCSTNSARRRNEGDGSSPSWKPGQAGSFAFRPPKR